MRETPATTAPGWVPAIGLEIHAQLLTRSKMFCACPTGFAAPPNSQVCPVCLGMPGALPVVNRRAVEMALAFGAAAGSRINERSEFARKNYFYPDLPKGYQITQYGTPICEGGSLEIDAAGEAGAGAGEAGAGARTAARAVRLERAHLEEDTARSIHRAGRAATLVDMNRAGIPLLEIVTRPELSNPGEARRALEAVKLVVEYLGICAGSMEEGSLRCDANVSLGRPGGPLGAKTEIKNLNSVRALERSLAAEIERQRALLDGGGVVRRETLLWDEKRRAVAAMRRKEAGDDYRYFPEPDLPPLRVTEAMIAAARSRLPELPAARARRFRERLALPEHDARLLTTTRELADFFEAVVSRGARPKAAANLIMGEVLRAMNEKGGPLASLGLTPEGVAELAAMADAGRVGSTVAREVFQRMMSSGEAPGAIVEREGWAQEHDDAALGTVVGEVIAAHGAATADFRAGRTEALEFLVGAVMKSTRGKADAALARRLLAEAMRESFPAP